MEKIKHVTNILLEIFVILAIIAIIMVVESAPPSITHNREPISPLFIIAILISVASVTLGAACYLLVKIIEEKEKKTSEKNQRETL